jgi:hypothetical protein
LLNNINFIQPFSSSTQCKNNLTLEYIKEINSQGKIIQIILDNCTIQRMERLYETVDYATLKDLEDTNSGLKPLAEFLQDKSLNILMSASGVYEMPGKYVFKARLAYKKFCRDFWKYSLDDPNATKREIIDATENKLEFENLDEEYRMVYGFSYVSLLQIQNILNTCKNKTPEEQFLLYLHSIISMIDIINGFELELAKYAFWRESLSDREFNALAEQIKKRLTDIRENFTKPEKTLAKCKWRALNGSMDIGLLNMIKSLEANGNNEFNIDGIRLKIDFWIGTHDRKLFNIANDIYSKGHGKDLGHIIATVREKELSVLNYWIYVDAISQKILLDRTKKIYDSSNMLDSIDLSVKEIENFLANKI